MSLTCQNSACGVTYHAPPRSQSRLCPECRTKQRGGRPPKYPLTAEARTFLKDCYDGRAPGRIREIAANLHWPEWAVRQAATKLGLTRPSSPNRRAWNDDDLKFLLQWEGRRTPRWIGQCLGRSEASVLAKIQGTGISRRLSDGYTAGELAKCFGVDPSVVVRWVRSGLLKSKFCHTARGADQGGDVYRIAETDVWEFVCLHPDEFSLRKVDQVWFMGLVSNPLLERVKRKQERERKRKKEVGH